MVHHVRQSWRNVQVDGESARSPTAIGLPNGLGKPSKSVLVVCVKVLVNDSHRSALDISQATCATLAMAGQRYALPWTSDKLGD